MAQVGSITLTRYDDTSVDIKSLAGGYSKSSIVATFISNGYTYFEVYTASKHLPNFQNNSCLTISCGFIEVAVFLPIIFYKTNNITYVKYYDGESYITVPYSNFGEDGTFTDFTLPLYDATESAGATIAFSTNSGTISATIGGAQVALSNVPVTRELSGDSSVIIDVPSHMPKDSYAVNINDGGNLSKVVDGSIEYTSFPNTITINSNKSISAYGKPDKTITVEYQNTSVPIITNS